MKPYTFTDSQELAVNRMPAQEDGDNASSSGNSDTDGNYPRELNKGGLVISVIISVVVMVVLLVSTV